MANEFSQAFHFADRVVLTDIYSAGEENPNHVDVKLIYEAVKKGGHPDVRIVGRSEIINFLMTNRESEEVIAFLGAGDIGEIADEFANRFKNVAQAAS